MNDAGYARRNKALRDAAKAVCPWCAGNAFPGDGAPLTGPNEAGNYTHLALSEVLCSASSIWSIVAWENGLAGVAALSPRGWSP